MTSYGDRPLRPAAESASPSSFDRRRGTGQRAERKPWPNCAPSSRKRDSPQQRHPHLPARRDAHLAPHPERRARELHGFIHMFEDTPEFIARNVVREAKAYLIRLPPPFFRALTPLRRRRLVFLALPGPLGRRRLPEVAGGPDVPPVLRREHAAPTSATPSRNSASCSTIPGRLPPPNATPRASSTDHLYFVTNGTSPPTRSSGIRPWRRATSSSSTATATSRSCTPSS